MAVGEKLKRKKTVAELPDEVIHVEILTRLPIKSVVRFKSVSKSWLSLFSHPQFAKEHHTRNATQNPNDYDCVIAKKQRKIVILSRYKESFLLPSDIRFTLVGSIRGLVCLCNDKKFSLWNPAIHQSKEFTLPPRRSCCTFTGFGFDPVSNDYKVVVLSVDKSFATWSATVYHSNSGSWIDISVPDHVFPEKIINHSYNPTTIVKDCPYWTFASYTRDRHPHIRQLTVSTSVSLIAVKFDAGSNEFKKLPEFHFDTSVDTNAGESYAFNHEFVDMNDCFTLMMYDRNSSNCMVDIYSLDGEEGCCVWSKMYSIGPLDFRTRHWYVSVAQGFKYGGEILYHDDGIFFCYNHKIDTIKRLRGTTSTNFSLSLVTCFTYTPSLVFLQGMKSVHLTTQTRTHGICSRTPRRLISSLRD